MLGDAFIVCHGSFNPVHRHHVQIMVRARRKLEEAGYRVISGILAPTLRDNLFRWKCISAIKDIHRFAALHMACKSEEAGEPQGWLYCDERGVRFGACHKMIHHLLLPEFKREHPEITGFEVKGADVVVRYGSYASDLWYPTVIVCRHEAELVQERMDLARTGCIGEGKRTFLVTEELPGAMSSTKVRMALRNGDDKVVRRMCTSDVASYLIDNRSHLYRETIRKSTADGIDGWIVRKPGDADDGDFVSGFEVEARERKRRRLDEDACPSPVKSVQVYFVASAESSSASWVWANSPVEQDPLLTELGESQASQLQDHAIVAALGRPLVMLVSPLRRALQTARLASYGECKIIACPELLEIRTEAPQPVVDPQVLAGEFPSCDFSRLEGSSSGSRLEIDHDIDRRKRSFAQECVSHSCPEVIAITHPTVINDFFGAVLDNCDMLGMELDLVSFTWSPLIYIGSNNETLRTTARFGTKDGVRALLAGGMSHLLAGTRLDDGYSMIHYAAKYGNDEAVAVLLEARADVTTCGPCSSTALDLATANRWPKVVEVIQQFSQQDGLKRCPSKDVRGDIDTLAKPKTETIRLEDAEELPIEGEALLAEYAGDKVEPQSATLAPYLNGPIPDGPIRVLFIRHGEARHNTIENAWKERDPALTSTGKEQALKLRRHPLIQRLLQKRSKPLCITSPLQRTLQTAVLGCNDFKLVANSDLQEITLHPCDTGRPQAMLAKEFPIVDFSCILDDAWMTKQPPLHHDLWERWDRFLRWCAACTEEEVVAVTHQQLIRANVGVMLENCDVVGVAFDRKTLAASPYMYTQPSLYTLKWTATKCEDYGVRILLADEQQRGEMVNRDLGDGWPMLHYAAGCGNADAVRALLECRADLRFADSSGKTARDWARISGWNDVVALLDAAAI